VTAPPVGRADSVAPSCYRSSLLWACRPVCESYVEASQVNAIEAFYPLRVYKTVVGYGGPGKRNMLLSYGGIRTDFIDFTDRNPYKQGRSGRVPTSRSIRRRRSPRSSPT
jgi:hypothetical protein